MTPTRLSGKSRGPKVSVTPAQEPNFGERGRDPEGLVGFVLLEILCLKGRKLKVEGDILAIAIHLLRARYLSSAMRWLGSRDRMFPRWWRQAVLDSCSGPRTLFSSKFGGVKL